MSSFERKKIRLASVMAWRLSETTLIFWCLPLPDFLRDVPLERGKCSLL